MTNLFFVLSMFIVLAAYLYWGITTLSRERWQILATVPVRKKNGDWWDGLNLTWYGLLTGNAYAVSVAVLFILMGSVGVPLTGTAMMAAIMLAICVPASKLVAGIVEKKAHTFTVGGAVFVGVIMAPAVVFLVNRTLGKTLGFGISPVAALAALAIAYSFGEGLGRLACISFGCCYGKQLACAPSWQHRIFSGRSFIFNGKTRKIAYEGGLEGVEVIPVQALTAIIYSCIALVSTILFLNSWYGLAFILDTGIDPTMADLFRNHARRLPGRRHVFRLSNHGAHCHPLWNDRELSCARGSTGYPRYRGRFGYSHAPFHHPISPGCLAGNLSVHRAQLCHRGHIVLPCS